MNLIVNKLTAKAQWQMLDDIIVFGEIQKETLSLFPKKDALKIKRIYEIAYQEWDENLKVENEN